MRYFNYFDINIATGKREELFGKCREMLGTGGVIATVNPEILTKACESSELKLALTESLCIPDGIGVSLSLSALGYPCERLPGVELAEMLLGAERVRLGIIGGEGDRAAAALQMLTMRYRSVVPEFAISGYNIDMKAMRELFGKTEADVVFVCLGAPLQELFIKEMKSYAKNTLFIGLGGAVDVFSGEKRRAPKLLRALGLEWLWRMVLEPVRFARIPKILKFFAYLIKNQRKIGQNRQKIGKKPIIFIKKWRKFDKN